MWINGVGPYPAGVGTAWTPAELVIYDLDGTLIENFLVDEDCHHCHHTGVYLGGSCTACRGQGTRLVHAPGGYARVAWLPNRLHVIRSLFAAGVKQALATNQTGVAWGHQEPTEVLEKLARVRKEACIPLPTEFSMHAVGGRHPFNDPAFALRRKPSPSMLRRAMRHAGVDEEHTIFVGDMPTDREAAVAAGVTYWGTDLWFATLT